MPTASWLHQAGWPLAEGHFSMACKRGDLPMVRWLLQAGCPRGQRRLDDVLRAWPCNSAADREALVEAVRLLAAAGRPAGAQHLQFGQQPWAPWRTVHELLSIDSRSVPRAIAIDAAKMGCWATLEALAGMGVYGQHRSALAAAWYVAAAKNGDRGTLECLAQLGVPLGDEVLAAAVRMAAPVPAREWLVRRGAPWREEEVKACCGA